MAAVISLSLWWIWLSASVLRSVASESKREESKSGQNVTLTCRAPNNNNDIIIVEWSKTDLGEEYVLLYRNGHFDPDQQHPSFKNRVDLQDRQMKDGDVSLILKNVTINDTGTYECGVIQTGTLKFLSIIHLHVDPPGQTGGDTEDGGKKDGSVGLIAGLSVSALLLVAAVVGFLIYRNCKKPKQSQHPYQPPDDLQHGNGSAIHTESEKPALLKQTEG